MMQLTAGDILNFSIFAQAGGGAGLAKAPDGRVVLVEGSLTGEEVRARVLQVRKDYVVASTLEVLTASPARVRPRCELFGVCGGCDLMHLDYDAQVKAKAVWVAEAMRNLPGLPQVRAMPSPRVWHYRNRLRLHVRTSGAGFFARSSRDLVPLEACPVAAESLERMLPGLNQAMQRNAGPRPLWLEALAGEDRVFFTVGFKQEAHLSRKSQRGLYLTLTSLGAAGVRFSLGKNLGIWPISQDNGIPYLEINGQTLWAFPGLFSQVNFAANRLLVETVLKEAGDGQGRDALDLYSGSGNFTLPLAAAGWQVLGVEGSAAARPVAQAQALWNGLEQDVSFITASAGNALKQLGEQGRHFDLVVLDPPRAGAKGLMPLLQRLGPGKIIYVSCHPAALARDAQVLRQLGYAPTALYSVDLFPHTGHVEALLVMEKA